MSEIQLSIFGNHVVAEKMPLDEIEAHIVPTSVAVCPICGRGLWIESIDEAVEADDGVWLPNEISLTCETESDVEIGSIDWDEWFRGHYSTPYIDWLPVDSKVLKWMQQPEQRQRFELIWNSRRAEFPPCKTAHCQL